MYTVAAVVPGASVFRNYAVHSKHSVEGRRFGM